MQRTTRTRIQIFLIVLLALVAVRLALIWYERHEANAPAQSPAEGKLPADYYVVPEKTHAYDLASLRKAVVGRPVWVREGYRWTYFPFNATAGKAQFEHPAGQLRPLEKLDIREITTGVAPEAPNEEQALAVFREDGRDYAFSVGAEKGGNIRIYIDEMVYIQDPHQLYSHWSQEVWNAIERHEVEPGMNQLQASFAVGFGQPGQGSMNDRTVRYANGGKPVEVTYRNDKAVSVKPAGE